MSRPNVLLVVLDSVRASNCSLYGYGRETTPELAAFAADNVLFEQARAPSIHSIASHASIFSGYHTVEHGVTEHKSFLDPEATVWRDLAAEGYDTGLFTPNVIVSQTSNLADAFGTCVGPKRTSDRLFDGGLAPLDVQGSLTAREYLREALSHEQPVRSVLNGAYKRLTSRGGDHDPDTEDATVYTDAFLDWVDGRDGTWAACLNLMDAHTPFLPTPAFDNWSGDRARAARERIERGDEPEPFTDAFWDHLAAQEPLYDGTIRQVDAAVGQLVDALSQRDVFDETLVVVTSDHGEGFGERSALAPGTRLRHHSWGIDEELTHVPLVVSDPADGSRTVSGPASLTRFPSAVAAARDGSPVASAFAADEVLSATERIVPPGDELDLPPDRRDPYFGPWRAVYRSTDDGVVKFARRGDDAAQFLVPDAQTLKQRADTDDGVVEEAFGELTDAGVRLGAAGNRDVDDAVEDRLGELGYLR